jgi:hypothetical protein
VKDWEGIAKASGVEIPAAELQRAAKTLDALEATFRPLVASLEVSLEPAAVFQAEEDAGDHRGSG